MSVDSRSDQESIELASSSEKRKKEEAVRSRCKDSPMGLIRFRCDGSVMGSKVSLCCPRVKSMETKGDEPRLVRSSRGRGIVGLATTQSRSKAGLLGGSNCGCCFSLKRREKRKSKAAASSVSDLEQKKGP